MNVCVVCFRMEVLYVPGSTESHLQIRALELTDEAVYKCEITYMEVRENCDVVQFVNLTTLGKCLFAYTV